MLFYYFKYLQFFKYCNYPSKYIKKATSFHQDLAFSNNFYILLFPLIFTLFRVKHFINYPIYDMTERNVEFLIAFPLSIEKLKVLELTPAAYVSMIIIILLSHITAFKWS